MKTRLSSLNPLSSIFLSFFVAVAITSCGGGGGSSDVASETNTDAGNSDSGEGADSDNANVLIGIFVDSAVEGVSYSTATQSGTTNSAGDFSYIGGEQVTFSIGAVQFPVVDAAPQVSPVDMAVGASNPTDTTTNIARLLQSLDADGDPSNGITISAEAAANSALINFDVSADQFANDPAVINLVANSGSVNSELISEIDAISHLEQELNAEISPVNNASQTGPVFSSEMLIDRTLVPFPIDGALNPHSTIRFDSSSEAMVVGTPGGELNDGGFPWSIDGNGVVTVDFSSFEAGTLATSELESIDEGVLTVKRTWQGNPDPTLSFTLSTPVSTSDFAGRTISVQSTGGTGTIEFRTNGEFELSNSSGDLQTGSYSQHPVDGIIAGDFPSSYSEFVLTSGSLDDGFIMKSDFGGNDNFGSNDVLRVEFYETNGSTWTALHSVAR